MALELLSGVELAEDGRGDGVQAEGLLHDPATVRQCPAGLHVLVRDGPRPQHGQALCQPLLHMGVTGQLVARERQRVGRGLVPRQPGFILDGTKGNKQAREEHSVKEQE